MANPRIPATAWLLLLALLLSTAGATGTNLLIRNERPPDRPSADYCSAEFRHLLIHTAKAHKGDLSTTAGFRNLAGWLDLIKALEQRPCEPPDLEARLRRWREAYPDHPAPGHFPGLFRTTPTEPAAGPVSTDLALLAPLSGPHARFGRLLAEGVRDAARHAGLNLRIYDTNAGEPGAAVRRAREQGAGCIVGPLLKERVRRLAALGAGVPVLALNYLPDGQPAPGGFYQMALAPEDEARALAELLDDAGHSSGVLLYPRGWDWGERIAARFSTLWRGKGGRIADSAAYDPRLTDFTGPIKRLLGIRTGDHRSRPRRRSDIDFIVLLADYRLGRMLHPQLRFWYSGDLPVYTSSHILDGRLDDIHYDLEGVRPVIPAWLVDTAAAGRSGWDAAAWFLGGSAARIAGASGCLSPGRLAGAGLPDWRFDPASGRFHYRSRAAVINGGRLRFRDR